MTDLTIPPNALRILVEQLRAVQVGLEADDGQPDMRSDELRMEIEGLLRSQQHELVALLWIGRGDFDDSEWGEAVALARDRHTGPTYDYLMSQPLAGDHIASGLEETGHDHILLDGEF